MLNQDPSTAHSADAAPADPYKRRLLQAGAGVGVALSGLLNDSSAAASQPGHAAPAAHSFTAKLRAHVKTVVVIYLENRSFNNLFGNFPGVSQPLSEVPTSASLQRDRNGAPLPTLPKVWGGLVPTSQTLGGKTWQIGEDASAGLRNAPFALTDSDGKPLSQSLVTRDLWHLFYQNQMQINGGRNDQFAAWADSGGLPMGYYSETASKLGMWQIARESTLCDNFFMAAFGGSFLNHQYLACARTPVYPDAANSVAKGRIAVTEDGPSGARLALAANCPASALDGPPKFVNDGAITPDGYAVNTMAPPFQPSFVPAAPGGDPAYANALDARTLPPQEHDTIGDLLSAKGVSWAWYAGAWQTALDAQGGGPKPNFQYHHQPFNYFRRYAPGTAARAEHLRDGGVGDSPQSNHFLADALAGKLPAVSFYKPQGNLNLHAGYSDLDAGDQHFTNVIAHLRHSPQWKNIVVFVTFDENGGWWDHVAPPKGDRWGPGSRVPTLVVSPYAKKAHVDHNFYDTTSILRFITRLHGLPLLEGLAARNQAFESRGARPPGDLSASLSFV